MAKLDFALEHPMFALLFHSLPRYDAPNSIDHPLVNWGPGRPEQALDLAQASEQLFNSILHGNKKPARGGLGMKETLWGMDPIALGAFAAVVIVMLIKSWRGK